MSMNHLPGTLRPVLVALCLASLSGCGFMFGDEGVFRDRSEDYKKSPALPPIEVPQGSETREMREIYVIPAIDEKLVPAGEFEVPRPAPLVAGEGADVVRIQKLGDQSWALIGVPPGQVWPQVRSFLAASNIPVARVDARAGLMETGWLQLEDRPLQSRFRFRMEQGVQRGTSELHILQMNQSAQERDWPPVSDDPDLAGEMLRTVSQYLVDSADTAPVSMIAEQGIRSSGKISMQEAPEGYTYLRLELPFDRAWASLGSALQKSRFEVTDRDRSRGVYYARFLGAEDDGDEGWMDWLWDSDEDHPMTGQVFLVTMVQESEGVVTIRLRPEDETARFDKREEQGLLAIIKGNVN